MSGREIFYALAALAGLLLPWYFNLEFAQQTGTLLDLGTFIGQSLSTPASSSLTMDLTVAFVVFVVWSVIEGRRIGLRSWWVYPLLGTFVAFACAFPLFLLMRERRLRQLAQ